jgi:hypothetical protein
MYTPGELKPQHLLTARRKRAFLSFRRKSDLVWFGLSLILFSGGATALGVAVLYFGRGREPLVAAVPTPAPLLVPGVAPSAPAVHGVDDSQEPRAVVFLAAEKSLGRKGSPLSPTKGTKGSVPSPPIKSKEVRRPPSSLRIEVHEKWAPLRGQNSGVFPKKGSHPPEEGDLSRGITLPLPQKREGYLLLKEAGPFKPEHDRKAALVLERLDVDGEPALQLTYDLTQGTWVQCVVNVRENFLNYSRVQFLFKGEGAANTLEFKMADADGAKVGALWSLHTAKNAWTVVDIPFSDLTPLGGGDGTWDVRRLRQIFIAVSKKAGDKGGRGRVITRGIKFS